jgi:hypothetical protein
MRTAHVIGFAIELSLILLGKMAVVVGHVLLFVVLEALFAFFKAGRLSRRQLVVLDAICDPVLLIRLALINLIHARMAGIDLARAGRSVGVSCRGGSDTKQRTRCRMSDE